jgi:hypothetical protein
VGVLVPPVLPELGVSVLWNDLPLLGVDFVIVGRLPSTVIGGTVISEGVTVSVQVVLLLCGISIDIFFPVLLSLLLSRILLGSPRTARGARDSPPAELPPEGPLEGPFDCPLECPPEFPPEFTSAGGGVATATAVSI